MLEPHTPSTIPNRTEPPPAPVEVEGDLEYEIAEILDTKIDKRRQCKLLYYVWWLGYEGTDEETSWLPADELGHAADLVKEFHRRYPDKSFRFFLLSLSIVLLLFLFPFSHSSR